MEYMLDEEEKKIGQANANHPLACLCLTDISSLHFPFCDVSFVFYIEANPYFNSLLVAHGESVSIMVCVYLGESFIGSIVKFQFHDVNAVLCLQRYVCTTF